MGDMKRAPLEPGLLQVFRLGYLSWPWLRDRLGKVYLPLALTVASAGPIVEYTLTVSFQYFGDAGNASIPARTWGNQDGCDPFTGQVGCVQPDPGSRAGTAARVSWYERRTVVGILSTQEAQWNDIA